MAASVLGKRQRGALDNEGAYNWSCPRGCYFLSRRGPANLSPLLGPAFPVRTPSKRRARTPQILREDVQSTVPVPRQLRSRGKGVTSIVEEPQQENEQENEHPGTKSVPVVEIRSSRHTAQVTPAGSPKKAGSQSAKAPAAENGMLLLLLATKRVPHLGMLNMS